MTLEILTVDELLPLRHGFFGRRGGVSSGIFAGLNCGPGSSDQRDAIITNRRLVSDAMGGAADLLLTAHQSHSSDVLVVEHAFGTARPKCDAMVTNKPGLLLAVLTADCQPVLLADRSAGVIGVAHAGWKGALDGVLENTIAAMEGLGANRGRISAIIGPCISQSAYEVGPEFVGRFLCVDQNHADFFVAGQSGRMMFDLPAFGLFRLRRAGIGSARWTGHCTYDDPGRFYSYRRSTHRGEVDYGRQISLISL